MVFEFNAREVETDDVALRVGFAGGENSGHYFIMQREEGSLEEVLPNLENIYFERDGQGWGGYGRINQIALTPNSLTIYLCSEMANQMGGYDTISVAFSLESARFQDLQSVLRKIMQGYENRLEEKAAAPKHRK